MGRVIRFVLPALLVLAVYWAVFGGEYSVLELRRARQELRESRLALAALQAEIDSLQAWADSLRNDDWLLERLARERHGLIGPGEEAIRITDASPGDSAAADTTRN